MSMAHGSAYCAEAKSEAKPEWKNHQKKKLKKKEEQEPKEVHVRRDPDVVYF